MANPIDFHPTGDVEFDTLMNEVNAEIMATNDFLLTDEMVLSAVTRSCDFFNLPEVPVIHADGTCVWPNDTTTYADDVLGFNRAELMSMGISGEDSLTLIYTHECAHRTLQGAYNDSWEEELACDFFAGVHAGLRDINIDNFEAALGATAGGASHPAGALRAEFIEFGQQIADEMQERGIEVTYEGCLERLNQHLEEKEGLIAEYRQRIDPTYHGLTEDSLLAQGESTSNADEVAQSNVASESCGSVGLVEPASIEEGQPHFDISGETLGSIGLAESVEIDEDSVKGLTKAEIDRKVAKAEKEERYYKGMVEHELYMAKHSTDKAGGDYHTSKASSFAKEAAKWHEEAIKWKYTKPDEK